MNILYNILLSIQVVLIDAVTLVTQPLWFVYSIISDVTDVWNAKESEQPKEENHHIGFNR